MTASKSPQPRASRPLKVAVVLDDPSLRQEVTSLLVEMGHRAGCPDDRQQGLVGWCLAEAFDVLLIDADPRKLERMGGLGGGHLLSPLPVIAIAREVDSAVVETAASRGVQAFLACPLTAAGLQAALIIAQAQFTRLQAVRREAADLRRALVDRKVIERAKGILMKYARVDDQEALRRLHVLANRRDVKLAAAAEMVVGAQATLES